MRTITVVLVARSDYRKYLAILEQLEADQELALELIVSGMTQSAEFRETCDSIEAAGFTIRDRVEVSYETDSPVDLSKSLGQAIGGFAEAYGRKRPDLLFLLGDRYEMLAAASSAIPFRIPIAHLHGGELTPGFQGEPIRHSLTKMSHLHFTETEESALRMVRMGEEPWRVSRSGTPSLDHLGKFTILSPAELEQELGFSIESPSLLITCYSETLEHETTQGQMKNLLEALDVLDVQTIFTYPRADSAGQPITEMISQYVEEHERAHLVTDLEPQVYFSLLHNASALVGNTSSGIYQAASFHLPVVNIGLRQRGRLTEYNVINVGWGLHEIFAGIATAIADEFRASLIHLVNPYGDGNAAEKIVRRLREVPIGDRLLHKRFHDPRPESELPSRQRHVFVQPSQATVLE